MIPHEHKNHPGNRHADNVPGYLLANIPAVLGFYPQESLVLAGLEHREGHTYHLGPVLRADYPVPGEKAVRALAEGVAEGLSMIRSVGSTSVMVFVVGVAPPRSEIAALRRCLWHPGLRIWGGWWCRGIATGERYARLWEESGASRWPGALISEVAQTPAMRALVERGELPELTRAEACAHFSREGRLWKVNQRDADRLVHEVHRKPELLAELAAEGHDLLRGGGDASHLALLLSHPLLRDALVPVALRCAEEAHGVLRRVARHTEGETRMNALCLYAIAAAACGRSWRVPLALHTAVAESPGHSLSRLLYAVVTQCGIEAMLKAVADTKEDPEGAAV